MDLKETFEDSGFTSASKVIDIYRFLHKVSDCYYRVEIALQATGRYTAIVYCEVQARNSTVSTLEMLSSFPWIDELTPGAALNFALNFLEERLR